MRLEWMYLVTETGNEVLRPAFTLSCIRNDPDPRPRSEVRVGGSRS